MPDIIKVRLQTSSQYSGALDAGTQIFRKEGPAAFYKGTLTPRIGIGACVSPSLQLDLKPVSMLYLDHARGGQRT